MTDHRIAARLRSEDLERLDTLKARLQELSPHRAVSLSDTIRHALIVASATAAAPAGAKAKASSRFYSTDDSGPDKAA